MKYIILITSFIFFSCNQKKDNANNSSVNKIKEEYKLSGELLNKIKLYYNKSYGTQTEILEEKTDSIFHLNYRSIPQSDDDFSMTLMSASIPLNNKKGIYIGDLNSDNQEDILVTVWTEGGGGGGNVWWTDYFLFLKNSNTYKLIEPVTNWEINDCSGFFGLEKIESNTLVGNSLCYGPEDGRCCPSLEYRTFIEFKDHKFRVISNQLIKKKKNN